MNEMLLTAACPQIPPHYPHHQSATSLTARQKKSVSGDFMFRSSPSSTMDAYYFQLTFAITAHSSLFPLNVLLLCSLLFASLERSRSL